MESLRIDGRKFDEFLSHLDEDARRLRVKHGDDHEVVFVISTSILEELRAYHHHFWCKYDPLVFGYDIRLLGRRVIPYLDGVISQSAKAVVCADGLIFPRNVEYGELIFYDNSLHRVIEVVYMSDGEKRVVTELVTPEYSELHSRFYPAQIRNEFWTGHVFDKESPPWNREAPKDDQIDTSAIEEFLNSLHVK